MTLAHHHPHNCPLGCPKLPASHRVRHHFQGDDECTLVVHGEACALPASQHIPRTDRDSEGHRKPRKRRRDSDGRRKRPVGTHKSNSYFVGIDGEGQGKKDHKYTLLAASEESGVRHWFVEAPPGERLSTIQCLDFLLALPNAAKAFAYSFNYDITKILTDLDDGSIYRLMRPELRQRRATSKLKSPIPVVWKGYVLNLQGRKFSVKKAGRKRTVWDIFAFYQSKFVKALSDWKVSTPEALAEMETMKNQRAEFDKLDRDAIRAYCLTECRNMAELARRLVEAHDDADLPLKSFYGAGSTASVLLDRMNIAELRRPGPPAMQDAIARSFFGGRFEHSVTGMVTDPVHAYDISSAYPYQTRFLPCLAHGTWTLTKDPKRMRAGKAALVHYGLHKALASELDVSWGPFPFRTETGSIVFPIESGGGWVWRDEYLAGHDIFSSVFFREAWVLESTCKCIPFGEIPAIYVQRLLLGKEGPGIVLKLGPNSVYGKLAQSIGIEPPYQCWIWAAMVTSGCRAQILRMLGLHKDPRNLLAIATDGIYTREELKPPKPRDTQTDGVPDEHGETTHKPLGGWEHKHWPKGLFFARPGIYFRLHPTEDDVKEGVRARGMGRTTLVENWQKIVGAFVAGEPRVDLSGRARFVGAKTAISRVVRPSEIPGETVFEYRRSKTYGQWIHAPVSVSFTPLPKREAEMVRVDKNYSTLTVRRMPLDVESAPYKKSVRSPEALEIQRAEDLEREQPDADLVDYGDRDV